LVPLATAVPEAERVLDVQVAHEDVAVLDRKHAKKFVQASGRGVFAVCERDFDDKDEICREWGGTGTS
jgi:hypothetical protein